MSLIVRKISGNFKRSLSDGSLITKPKKFSTKTLKQTKFLFHPEPGNSYGLVYKLEKVIIRWKIIERTGRGLLLERQERLAPGFKKIINCRWSGDIFSDFSTQLKIKKGPLKGRWEVLKEKGRTYYLNNVYKILKVRVPKESRSKNGARNDQKEYFFRK